MPTCDCKAENSLQRACFWQSTGRSRFGENKADCSVVNKPVYRKKKWGKSNIVWQYYFTSQSNRTSLISPKLEPKFELKFALFIFLSGRSVPVVALLRFSARGLEESVLTDCWESPTCAVIGCDLNPPPLIYGHIVSAALHNSSNLSLPRPLTETEGNPL